MSRLLLTIAASLLGATTDDDALAPWASNHHPSDVAQRHVQEISAAQVAYNVVQRGTMDGRNCRSPQGVWQPFEQTWESNRSVRMENIGETDVVNPWLVSGRNDFRSLDKIAASAIEPGMTQSEKARALWWQEVQHRFHLEGDNAELLDPVKVFNVYGHNTCGNDSICLAGLWKKAGFKVAPARLVGHCVTQVFYGGAWHLMDGDMQSIYLLRDNETIAGEQDLVRDHDLIRRTHTQGILQPDRREGDEWESSIYVYEGKVTGERNSADTAANMALRPGEAIVWRWGHKTPVKYHGPRPPQFPDRLCNGLWEYRPDFARPSWRAGALAAVSIRDRAGDLTAEEGKTGVIVWTMKEPLHLCRRRRSKIEEPARGSKPRGTVRTGTRSIAISIGYSRRKGALCTSTTSSVNFRGQPICSGCASKTIFRWPRSVFQRWLLDRTRLLTATNPPTDRFESPTSGSNGRRAARPMPRPNRSFRHPEEWPPGPGSPSSGSLPLTPTVTRSPTTTLSSPHGPT